ncbi:hypothetical protein [Microbacterium lushaniae]|uniref:Uncharacterized protein n=1 Tax=Microbacterium lushaniae TaxID=2614639 RepID=A0A5J6L0M5_9MICO|nr:hypothetical protein [Microbacterium lushaniae]QEW02025.1 hypothetical protein F6J85_02200 [Microbacterium lushaniae]
MTERTRARSRGWAHPRGWAWCGGIAMGAALGVAFGRTEENPALGIVLGVGFGLTFALMFGVATPSPRSGDDGGGSVAPALDGDGSGASGD